MRKTVATLLICLFSGHTLVFAAERPINPPKVRPLPLEYLAPPGGILMAAAIREVNRVAPLEVLAGQAGATPTKRSGHPVLIGAVIGASVLAVAGYIGNTCSVPPPDDVVACGTRHKGASALLGAGVGAGVGALIGLAFSR